MIEDSLCNLVCTCTLCMIDSNHSYRLHQLLCLPFAFFRIIMNTTTPVTTKTPDTAINIIWSTSKSKMYTRWHEQMNTNQMLIKEIKIKVDIWSSALNRFTIFYIKIGSSDHVTCTLLFSSLSLHSSRISWSFFYFFKPMLNTKCRHFYMTYIVYCRWWTYEVVLWWLDLHSCVL